MRFSVLLLSLASLGLRPLQAQSLGEEIDSLAQALVDRGETVGLVVGTLRNGERLVRGYGRISPDHDLAPDGDTVYEIGSITKVFTGILLAEAERRGELHLHDHLAVHVPEGTRLPRSREDGIRLVDLSTHLSGLPRMPPEFAPADPEDPYADFGVDQLYASLFSGERAGSSYTYSNLAAGLLGQILSERAGVEFEDLVTVRILDPLGLSDTGMKLDDSQKDRLAPPYDEQGRGTRNWHFDALAGAGALRSTASNLLGFASVCLEPPSKELGSSIRRSLMVHGSAPRAPRVGLGWHLEDLDELAWHNGGTGGYRSFLAVIPGSGLAVVLLANTTSRRVDEVGRRILGILRREGTESAGIGTSPEWLRRDTGFGVGGWWLESELLAAHCTGACEVRRVAGEPPRLNAATDGMWVVRSLELTDPSGWPLMTTVPGIRPLHEAGRFPWIHRRAGREYELPIWSQLRGDHAELILPQTVRVGREEIRMVLFGEFFEGVNTRDALDRRSGKGTFRLEYRIRRVE